MESILKVVESKRRCPAYELEARLGRLVNDGKRFEVGVPRLTWHRILRSLCKHDGWASKTDFSTRVDYFYPSGDRLSKSFGDDAAPPLLIKKIKIKSADIQLNDSKFACRVACANEHTEPLGTLIGKDPTFVRLKYWCSFTTLSGFRFDISRVWHAPTLTAARQIASEEEGTFEVEIELVDASYMALHDNMHVVDSLLIKMNDLVAQFSSE
jgi:hypothetical protein